MRDATNLQRVRALELKPGMRIRYYVNQLERPPQGSELIKRQADAANVTDVVYSYGAVTITLEGEQRLLPVSPSCSFELEVEDTEPMQMPRRQGRTYRGVSIE